MRAPILARGRGPTARGRCHLSRPRGSRTRSVPGSATHTTPAAPAVNCAQLPDAAAVGGVGAVLPAFVSSVPYSPASRHLPPAAPPPSAKRASVAKPLPLRTNPYEPL